MFLPFDQLPDDARIWIYQSDRKFSDDELAAIDGATRDFVSGWKAHGQPLEASYELKHNRFIILAVNQETTQVSGCSIDESVRFIQDIEKQYGVQLLDKMNVTFRQSGHIAHKPLADFRKMAKDKSVTGDTVVFNNLVNTVGEYREFWEVPAGESWHARFF